MEKRKRIVFLTVIILFIIMIIGWIVSIKQGKMPLMDQWNRQFIIYFADAPVYTIFRWLTELGSKSFVQPFTILMTIVLWIWYRDYRPAFIFGLGTLGTHLLNKLIKELVMRERPSISPLLDAEGYSFPSGHAMVSIVCYGLLGYFISKKFKSTRAAAWMQISFFILIFLIGISRYILNVHFLTDIITGFVIGFIILILLIQLSQKVNK